MADYELRIDQAGLAAQVQPGLARAHASITRRIAAKARQDVPVRTGNLGRSIREDPQRFAGPLRVTGGVTATARYAVFVHEGTRPHVIRPRQARALRFKIGGRIVFARSVNHPGQRAQPFLRNAGESVTQTL